MITSWSAAKEQAVPPPPKPQPIAVLKSGTPIEEVIAAAAESYHLFFLVPDLKRRHRCEGRWRELLGDNVICMEAPEDACAVAAAIVGLTEGALADMGALAHTLRASDISAERTSAIVRALRPYADLLDPNAVQKIHTPASAPAPTPGAWWKRLVD